MRVLHVIGEFGYGGAELLVAQICADLVARGGVADIAVFGFCDEEVLSQARKTGIRVHRLDASLASPLAALRVRGIISKGDYSVVHAHLFPCLYWVALIARAFGRQGRVWIYTEHSTSNRRRRISWLSRVEGWIYSTYDHVVSVSPQVKQSLSAWVPAVESVVIPNGVPVEKFRSACPLSRSDIGIDASHRVVISVGALRSEKNHMQLLRAFAGLPDNCRLVLVGDGPMRDQLIELAAQLGVTARVTFLGSRSDVPQLLKLADVFALVSLHEGFGISAVEAVAAGCRVVYSDVAGLSELMQGVGWPCSPGDASSIAAALLQALESQPCTQRHMQGLALTRRFEIRAMIDSYHHIYGGVRAPTG